MNANMVFIIEQLKNSLNANLNACKQFIHSIDRIKYVSGELLQWFKELCKYLTKIIVVIGDYNKSTQEKLERSVRITLLLYLTQVLTLLSLLINIFVKEDEIKQVLKQSRWFASKQMIHCLEGIGDAINNGNVIIDTSGNFVKWMDVSLEKISKINNTLSKEDMVNICNESRDLFEEVLSHAMSIAQIAVPLDSKIIRGGSQMVLEAVNSLSDEINKPAPNGAMINLFVDVCSDKLCFLERNVNVVVLKLCLKVFAKLNSPLESIQGFCFDVKNSGKLDGLKDFITAFDLHIDRIMQVGLFAVSCSSDIHRGIKIRSCLASLEALEAELVPAFSAILLDNNLTNINYALILKYYWIQQAEALEKIIYLIIDPFAFCQVIYEELTIEVDNLNDIVKNNEALKEGDVENILNFGNVLKRFLKIALTELEKCELERLQSKLKDFNNVLCEIKSAVKLLLVENDSTVEGSLRVLKRCKIFHTVTKGLWFCFADETMENSIHNSLPPKAENLPTGIPFLDHIVTRGYQILKDRSILYKTPMKTNIFQNQQKISQSNFKGLNKDVQVSKIQMKKRSFINSMILKNNETSLDLQITEILNEITNLSSTFSKIQEDDAIP